jgi:hypothetical protein
MWKDEERPKRKRVQERSKGFYTTTKQRVLHNMKRRLTRVLDLLHLVGEAEKTLDPGYEGGQFVVLEAELSQLGRLANQIRGYLSRMSTSSGSRGRRSGSGSLVWPTRSARAYKTHTSLHTIMPCVSSRLKYTYMGISYLDLCWTVA